MRETLCCLSDNNQTDIIEAFNSTSRYLDDILNIDNHYFEQMVNSWQSESKKDAYFWFCWHF